MAKSNIKMRGQQTYGQLIYNKGDKNIQQRKDSPSTSGLGKARELCVKQ